MLALRIDLLTGRYVATCFFDRGAPEWPIHPARVFSALVAAYHDAAAPNPREREALEWLERQPPPAIACTDASVRTVVPTYVPVNDTSVLTDLSDAFGELRDAEAEAEALRECVDAAVGAEKEDLGRRLTRAESALVKGRGKFDRRLELALQPGGHSEAAAKAAREMLPEGRGRQPRTFPSVTPDEPGLHLVWLESSAPPEIREALTALVERVTRIGHSSSLVGLRLVDNPPVPTWVPAETGDEVFRVVTAGQTARLEEEFARHREEQPRSLPCRLQSYRQATDIRQAVPAGVLGDDWIVFRRWSGPAFPTRRAPDLARTLRDVVISHADQPVSEILSGHQADGRPSERPHVAYVALPFVDFIHADGSVLGVGLVLPRGASAEDRQQVLRALGRWEQRNGRPTDVSGDPPVVPLWMGRAGECEIQRVLGAAAQWNLNPTAWCRGSAAWATATPIALDRNPGDLVSRDSAKAEAARGMAAETIATGCAQIGLPRPSLVRVSPVSALGGAEAAGCYGPFPPKRGRLRRVLVHADIRFERPVHGPVILGAGRYVGLGLCRPLRETYP